MRLSGAIRTSVIVLVGTTVAACSTFLPGTHVPRSTAGAGAGTGANPGSGTPAALQDNRLKIEGVVRMPDGDNSEGIVVRAYPAFGPPDSLYFEGVTDKNGHFSITLPDGTYNLIARRPGSTYRAIKWQVQAATFVDLDLTPTGTLKGKVVASGLGDSTGIEVFVPGTDIVGRTDANGNYTLTNVPVGSYQVAAKATGFGLGQAASTQVTAGQVATAGDISLAPAATAKGGLKGRLVYPDNSAASGVTVSIDGNGASGSTATKVDGTFTLSDLPATYVRLTVTLNGYQPLSLRLVVFAGQTTDLVEEIRLVASGGGSTPQPSGGASPLPSGGGSPLPSGGSPLPSGSVPGPLPSGGTPGPTPSGGASPMPSMPAPFPSGGASPMPSASPAPSGTPAPMPSMPAPFPSGGASPMPSASPAPSGTPAPMPSMPAPFPSGGASPMPSASPAPSGTPAPMPSMPAPFPSGGASPMPSASPAPSGTPAPMPSMPAPAPSGGASPMPTASPAPSSTPAPMPSGMAP
jgi:hypothetical protein